MSVGVYVKGSTSEQASYLPPWHRSAHATRALMNSVFTVSTVVSLINNLSLLSFFNFF